MMKWNTAGLAAIVALILGSGNGAIAQDPFVPAHEETIHPDSLPVYYEGEYCEDCERGHCFRHSSALGKVGYCMHYLSTLGGRQAGYSRGGYPGSGYPGNGFTGGPLDPRDPRQLDYQYLYRYRAPDNLVYPPANQPAGVVVYPYYTVKGPDDFFLNE